MTYRRWMTAWGSVVLVVSLSACSVISPDSWRVAPIEFDNALDDDALDGGIENLIDVTYSMANITADTAGGFWTESGGSWLHLDQSGDTLSRFNDDDFSTVHGISAVSPTDLVVSRTDRTDALGSGTGIFRFDTQAGTWTRIGVDATAIGDVAAGADGRIVFVDFLGETVPDVYAGPSGSVQPKPFAVRAIDATGRETTVLGADSGLTATAVAIETDSTGAVYVSTNRETFAIDVDGTVTSLGAHSNRMPVLAVSPAGNVLAGNSTADEATDLDWSLVRGSSKAQDVMANKGDCSRSATGGLAILQAGKPTGLPFSCGAKAAVWVTDTAFVLSIGDEAGTILVRVTPPESDPDR
ncbi:hypothetical protein [Cryobacterium cryoconiti]|uniref:SMP-30/Gluconolactonase/LRE-like region domain-containing protein n=1 Tax=Cryobacterium cryoconiti TaxID=1259239 RepID=A0A4Y8JT18_9MICO|nr:hypothetical protein [Cryobacterium cryoconiti]TFD27927.1 hypothetical protein E3T49_12690 [Cryobacterium cryoconiti]